MKHATAWAFLGLLLSLASCDASTTTSDAPAPAAPSPATPEATPAPSDAAQPAASDAAQPAALGDLQRVLEVRDPYERARRLAELVPTLGEEMLPQLRHKLERFRAGFGVVEFDLILRHWATLRPEEATDWAINSSPRLYRANAILTALRELARVDPAKAVPLVLEIYAQGADKGTVAQFALINGWFEKDRAEVFEYIQGLGAGPPRQRAIYSYLTLLSAAEGADYARNWAESLSDDARAFKQEAFQQLLVALAWVDRPAARRFCEAHCDGPYGEGLRGILIHRQLRDGEPGGDVIEWVARTAATDTEERRVRRDQQLSLAFNLWALRESERAIDWMSKKLAEPEPHPWLPVLYQGYARELAPEDPEKGLEWAAKIEDEFDRRVWTVRIARYWRIQDEEAAEAWLAQSPLDEAERAQVRNPRLPHYLPRIGPRPAEASERTSSSPTA